MNRQTWFFVLLSVATALCGNYVSAMWAKGDSLFSGWLLLLIVISPIIFIIFGLVASKVGVAVGSGTIDSLLSLSTIALGLFLFGEWHLLTTNQFIGIAFVVLGILLVQHRRQTKFPRPHADRLLMVCFSLNQRGVGVSVKRDSQHTT